MIGKTTQRDIALALKLSPITVSRVFNNRGYISEDTRQRVLEYAKSVGYTPDQAARALVRGTVAKLSVIITDHPVFFWDDVYRGISLAARQVEPLGFQVRVKRISHREPAEFAAALEEELRAEPDVLAVSETAQYPLRPMLGSLPERLPLVLFSVDQDHPSKACYVGSDYFAAGRLAAEALMKFSGGAGPIILINSQYFAAQDKRKEATVMRRAGFLDWFLGNAAAVEERLLGLGRKEIKAGLKVLLDEHPGKRLALYCVSSIIEEVAQGLRSLAPDPKPILIGHDLSPLLIRYLSEGTITAEIFQDPLLQGFSLVKKMEQIAAGGTADGKGDIIVPSQLVLAENGRNKSALELFMDSLEA